MTEPDLGTLTAWVLHYGREGDNRQASAFADALGTRAESKRMAYNRWRDIARWLGPNFLSITPGSRRQLVAPWPDVVIAIGRWSVPVARAIRRRSGGTSRIVFLGNPRCRLDRFDAVIATPDYRLPAALNLLVTPLPIVSPPSTAVDETWASDLPRPRTLLLVGGPIKHFDLTDTIIRRTVRRLALDANAEGGSLLASASPRTPGSLADTLAGEIALANHGWLAPTRHGGLAAMFAAADRIVVTGDSMTMIAEAVATGKPTAIVPLDLGARGRRRLGSKARGTAHRRDLRRFWNRLRAEGLAGTIDRPQVPRRAEAYTRRAVAMTRHRLLRAAPAATRPISLMPVAIWMAWKSHRMPVLPILFLLVAIGLSVSPVDLTPDRLPFVDHLDDLGLLGLAAMAAMLAVPSSVWRSLVAIPGRRRRALIWRGWGITAALALAACSETATRALHFRI